MVDHSFDPVYQFQGAEIQDQAKRTAGDFQICLQLTAVPFEDSGHCLDFYDDTIFDDEVRDVSSGNLQLVVTQGQCNFSPEIQFAALKLECQARNVRRLETARTHASM